VAETVRTPVVRSIVLAPDLAELRRVRGFVSEVAVEAGFTETRLYDIVLLTSEAAANAIEHAPVKDRVEVKTILYRDRLEVEVRGPGEFQTPDRLKEVQTRGLGLPLMAKLSDHLALYSAPEGGTLLALTFYRDGFHRQTGPSPLPPGLLELFETGDRLEGVFEAMRDGLAIFDDDCRCLYLNQAMAAQSGRPKEDLIGADVSSPTSGAGALGLMFLAAMAQGLEVTRESPHPHGDRWFEVSLVPFAGGYAMFTRDVTERRNNLESMRESEERYRLLAEENDRLYRQQRDIAENLESALLSIPSEIGQVRIGHLYRSATEASRVGGDFYDVFEVKGGMVCVLVGDVAGHGIEAARTATLVKDVVHAFAHRSVRPHEVLRRTNSLLVEKQLLGFVTLFLGILDGDTGSFRYASAGHPEALLKRANGEIESLGSGSTPLGIDPDAVWRPADIELQRGDILLLYTDGVTEARRDGEFFGEKRLKALLERRRLSVERLPHVILDQVLAFSGGNLRDDIAILSLKLLE
jgi:serine phosphatase RsbU (regulator of sigma subunit)/anti-sigma regulatory factor (Ser/Thr protein kinase)